MLTEKEIRTYFNIDGDIHINKNDVIYVNGDADMIKYNDRIPFQFDEVTTEFSCSDRGLTSLVGSPSKVGTGFFCYGNKLTDLVGGPVTVGDNYSCFNNPLVSFKGAPDSVGGVFYASYSDNLPMLSLLKYNKIHIRVANVNVVTLAPISVILNEYVGKRPLRQAIIQCQKALIDAGYKENARL